MKQLVCIPKLQFNTMIQLHLEKKKHLVHVLCIRSRFYLQSNMRLVVRFIRLAFGKNCLTKLNLYRVKNYLIKFFTPVNLMIFPLIPLL